MKIKHLALLTALYTATALSADSYYIRLFIDGIPSSNTPEIEAPINPDPAQNSSEWLAFLKGKAYPFPVDFTDMAKWENTDYNINITKNPLSDDILPSGTLGVSSLYRFDIGSYINTLTNVDFLRGLKTVRYVLSLTGMANLSNLNGLQDLEKANYLYINTWANSNPSLTDITGLRNLRNIDYLNLNSQSKLTDLTPLSGIIGGYKNATGVISLDLDPFESKKSVMWNTPLCQAMKNNKMSVSYYYIRNNASLQFTSSLPGGFCKSDDPWIDILNTKSRYHWGTLLTSSDIPDPDAPVTNTRTLNLGLTENLTGITDDSSFSGQKIPVRFSGFANILLQSTNLTNLNLLSDLNKINNLDLRNSSKLTDLSALSKFSSIGELIISNSPLTSLKGLENITSAKKIELLSNNNLTDLSALSNLTYAGSIITKDGLTYTYPAKNSPYCLSNNTPSISLYNTYGGYRSISKATFCN